MPPHLLPPPPCCCDCSWTLTSLIGSYLDLALAYLFLIGSSLIYFASKFLAVFGLALNCVHCNGGVFGGEYRCAHSRIGSVNDSIRTRFPFDVLFSESRPERLSLLGPEEDGEDGVVIGDRVAPVGRRIRRRRKKRKAVSLSPRPSLSWNGEGHSGNFGSGSKGVVEEGSVADGNQVGENAIPLVNEAPAASECCVMNNMPSSTGNVHTPPESEVMIKNLEQELEEAHAAHAALYLELEKERSAAATAADEAMAMILRLQNEKATVEMESRQYQRMIEEKSAYDEEEMVILKEIIVRRERENHVLEKELEAYRQTIPDPSLDLSNDPTEMLKTICDSIGNKERVSSKMKWRNDKVVIQFTELPVAMEESNIEFQEKGMVTTELWEEPSCLNGGPDGERDGEIKSGIPVDELEEVDQDGDQTGRDFPQFETEPIVLDVHVVDDKYNLDFEEDGQGSHISQVESPVSSNAYVSAETPVSSLDSAKERHIIDTFSDNASHQDRRSSMSAVDSERFKLATEDTLSDNASHLDIRRSSMSAVDSERFKLETEVDILRKRLKTIEQGRGNLSFAVEYKEKETFQLQLLDEIACQSQEIKKITEPGRNIRQASLPPLSSKASSKKRRCRSVSWELHESA